MEPKKFFYLPGSDFFKDGDQLCCLRSVLCAKQELLVDNTPVTKSRQFGCEHAGCSEVFMSESEYQGHCLLNHAFKCISCKRTYPSAHLLDLHIAENHDPMQTAPSFRCFVPSCVEAFSTQTDRRDHYITIHKFPPDYRYDSCSGRKRATETCGASTSGLSNQDRPPGQCPKTFMVPNRVTFGRGNRSFDRRIRVQNQPGANSASHGEPMSMDTS